MIIAAYELLFDLAVAREVPVTTCPCCGNAATVRLEFYNKRVRCALFTLVLPSPPMGEVRCLACGKGIKKKHWPAEVVEVFRRERGAYRGKFRFRPGILLGALALVVGGMYAYQELTLPIGYKESDDAYVLDRLDNLRPGIKMAVDTSLKGRHYRLPILVDRVENGLIYARPYRVQMEDATYFLDEDTDLSEANFLPEATVIFTRWKSGSTDLILKEVDGKPAPQFTPRVSVNRVYGGR